MAKVTVKTSVRINEDIYSDIEKMAAESNKTTTKVLEDALKLYRDTYYMEHKATVINEDILKLSQSSMELLEHRINNKTNQVLSEVAIQVGVMVQVLASAYKFNPDTLDRFRKKSVDFLRTNNRVLKLSEIYRSNNDYDEEYEDE